MNHVVEIATLPVLPAGVPHDVVSAGTDVLRIVAVHVAPKDRAAVDARDVVTGMAPNGQWSTSLAGGRGCHG